MCVMYELLALYFINPMYPTPTSSYYLLRLPPLIATYSVSQSLLLLTPTPTLLLLTPNPTLSYYLLQLLPSLTTYSDSQPWWKVSYTRVLFPTNIRITINKFFPTEDHFHSKIK